MTRFRSRARSFVLAVCVPAFGASTAGANEVAAAESLFLEGRALIERGEVDAACDKFAESQRLEPSSGTLLNLAACHERQGKTATAWAEYRGAERLATQQGKAGRAAEAHRKVTDLEPHLSYLTLRVTNPSPGLIVKRDETQFEGGALGAPIPTDPGRHRITVTAPRRESFAVDVVVGVFADKQTVVIPELRPLNASGPLRPPPPAAPVERPRDPTIGLAVTGSGLALAGAGGAFFILAVVADGKAKSGCRYQARALCSEDAIAQADRRDTFATLATIGGIAGAVGVGAGAFLLFGPRLDSPEKAPRAALVPRANLGGGTLSVEGAF